VRPKEGERAKTPLNQDYQPSCPAIVYYEEELLSVREMPSSGRICWDWVQLSKRSSTKPGSKSFPAALMLRVIRLRQLSLLSGWDENRRRVCRKGALPLAVLP
jgi:hypothetical protein